LGLNRKEAATFSSWPEIGLAVENVEGTSFTNTGNIPAYDPETNEPDAIMADINQQQEMDHPDKAIRYDKYTFAQALHYLEKYQPEFLWISFEGADSAAHHNDLELYHQSLLFFDNALDTLFTTLKNLGIADSTLVIVTTDHGRGDGEHWTSHGVLYPESKRTWAFVMNGALIPDRQDGDIYQYSTLSMRPTIEAALKLRTARG
jgi:arylsulfatase A-like enzyme